ncbi:diadenylate cyclase CdaA [Lentisphaerota bacterium ZTH]|nr:diadenylate cyclase CdaA [Lentisphaerota bacterium]WET06219.1 diadenylate cyclase CdaA [Lentisphaerota bacterium ZTH]
MAEIFEYMQTAVSYLRPVLEILILTFLFYKILYYLRGTRGSNILAGMVIVLMLLTAASDLLKFEVISWMLNGLWTLLATAIIVIFQPELRRAFAQLGSAPFQQQSRKKEAITEVVTATLNMAKRKIGALMVLERKIGMRSIVEDAVRLDVKLNSMIIESIFFPNSPLHDGAVIIKNDRIIAAHAILPLTRDDEVVKTLGTRHRAAVGITEETDAVVVVVSEETGNISIACRGSIRRDVKADKLLRYLSGLMISTDDNSFANIFDSMQEDKISGFSKGGENE